jgi:nucleoside phosphorylase
LSKNGEFFIDKTKEIYLLLFNLTGKKITPSLKSKINLLKPTLIINFGIAGLLTKKYELETLILVKNFHFLDNKTIQITESIENKFLLPKFNQENAITLENPDESLNEDFFSKFGLLLDMEVFHYKKAASNIPFYSIKFISDYNKDLDKINLKELRNKLLNSQKELCEIVVSIRKSKE